MFSNFMIVGVFTFLLIAYLDRFYGTPTDHYLLGSLVRRNPPCLDSLRLSHIPNPQFRFTQVIFFITIIYFITGIVWFRKAIINISVVVFFIFISIYSRKVCYTPDVGFGINSPKNNSVSASVWPSPPSFWSPIGQTATEERKISNPSVVPYPLKQYPLFQLLPDFDSFKYNLSCTTVTEERRLNVLYIVVFLIYLACTYPSYLSERTARIEFWKHRKKLQ